MAQLGFLRQLLSKTPGNITAVDGSLKKQHPLNCYTSILVAQLDFLRQLLLKIQGKKAAVDKKNKHPLTCFTFIRVVLLDFLRQLLSKIPGNKAAVIGSLKRTETVKMLCIYTSCTTGRDFIRQLMIKG